jgi:acetoin utilization protein AcuB
MRLDDIMSEDVATIPAEATPGEARERMKMQEVRHLVVTEGRAIVGVLSQRDLARRRQREVLTVRDMMSAPVTTASPHTTLREAANLLRGHRVGCLPVLDDDRLVGIVTVSDLLDLIGKSVERPPAVAQHWEEKHRGHRRPRYVPGR